MGVLLKDIGEKLTFSLFGQFTIRAADGADLTPRGKKATALFAILAECATHKRARRWIEKKLWSDRDTDQARGSLRQTLFEIRSELCDYADIIQSDRTSVWLDPTRIAVLPPTETPREFLEGLEIADPAFRDWLSRKRLAHTGRDGDPGLSPRTIRIQCGLPWTAPQHDPIGSQIVNDQVASVISGFLARSKCAVLDTDVDLIVRATLGGGQGSNAVAVQVIDARRDELIHSDYSVADDFGALLCDPAQMGRFCWGVADHVLEKLAASRRKNDAVANRAAYSQDAINAVLSFDADVMPQSLDILKNANSDIEDGLFYALRAWALMSLIMEGCVEETSATLGEVRRALERAFVLAPGDEMVSAISANVCAILFEDYDEAFRLANAALRGRSNNIFAAQAMSLCRFKMGATDMAYQLSRQNSEIAQQTKFGAMCNLHHALLCLRTKRPEEALQSSRLAAEAAPLYRAPNRQLVALYAAGRRLAEAEEQARHLINIEPGFSIDRLLNDRTYPADTLRAFGYLDKVSSVLKAEG